MNQKQRSPRVYDKQKCAIIANEHIEMADKLEKVYKHLQNEGKKEEDIGVISWSLVTAFYCALHHVDAILRGKGYNPVRHEPLDLYPNDEQARNNLVMWHINNAYSHYKRLYEYSLQARYEPLQAKNHDLNDLEAADESLQEVIKTTGYKLPGILNNLP